MFGKVRDKYKVLIMKEVSGVESILKIKKIKAISKHVYYGKEPFPIDITKPSYRRHSTFVYILDINKGQIFLSSSEKINYTSPELTDAVFTRQIGKQLLSAIENAPIMGSIFLVLMALGLGLALGYIIGQVLPLIGG